MYHHSRTSYRSFLATLLSLAPALRSVAAENWHRHDPELWHFVTRPELRPPKWEIKVYDSEKLSDGYWFVAPKPGLDPTWGSGHGWWGPAIYDGSGELVWSGASQLDTPNIMDFRQSYVMGEHRLTMLDRDRKSGNIFNNDYEIYDMIYVAAEDGNANGHELNFIEGGKTVLYMTNNKMDATQEEKDAIGFSGMCEANYNGFKERDVKTGDIIFDWMARGHIKINESSQNINDDIHHRCNTYDFIHANSVDKTPDGDYILSARHCDTIYKISHVDGSIVWRLGGFNSDFQTDDVRFSRQHNIRSRGQNETHTLISFLDNAKGEDPQEPTHDFSRGLLIALRTDTTPMTASLVASYDQPRGGYAPRRGNMQILDNGNVFMAWSERALQSEHSPDGTLLMEAIFAVGWFGSYRNYKFPYVGRPKSKPDAVSVAYMLDDHLNNSPVTKVFVSWNGDTEVKTWKLYGSTSSEDKMEEIASTERKGFETSFEQSKYYTWVSLKGLDKSGKVLGETAAIKTEQHPSMPPGKHEQETGEATFITCKKTSAPPVSDGGFIFLVSIGCAQFVFILTWFGIIPLVQNRRAIFSRGGRNRGFTLRREEQAYNIVSTGDFDLDDDEDDKLPLTESDSSTNLASGGRSPR